MPEDGQPPVSAVQFQVRACAGAAAPRVRMLPVSSKAPEAIGMRRLGRVARIMGLVCSGLPAQNPPAKPATRGARERRRGTTGSQVGRGLLAPFSRRLGIYRHFCRKPALGRGARLGGAPLPIPQRQLRAAHRPCSKALADDGHGGRIEARRWQDLEALSRQAEWLHPPGISGFYCLAVPKAFESLRKDVGVWGVMAFEADLMDLCDVLAHFGFQHIC